MCFLVTDHQSSLSAHIILSIVCAVLSRPYVLDELNELQAILLGINVDTGFHALELCLRLQSAV